jgi:two-component system, NarL family, response regulator NreC
VRVLVADDHAVVRRGVRRLLEVAGVTVVAEAADGLETIRLCIQHRPDALVLDLSMPQLNGFEVVARLRGIAHQPAIVILSAHEEASYVMRAVEMGVRAYLSKSATDEDLIPAIYAAAGGRSFFSAGITSALVEGYVERLRNQDIGDPYQSLTRREKQVLPLLAEGRAHNEVAAVLDLSLDAVSRIAQDSCGNSICAMALRSYSMRCVRR